MGCAPSMLPANHAGSACASVVGEEDEGRAQLFHAARAGDSALVATLLDAGYYVDCTDKARAAAWRLQVLCRARRCASRCSGSSGCGIGAPARRSARPHGFVAPPRRMHAPGIALTPAPACGLRLRQAGYTALHYAAQAGYVPVARLLLKRKATPDARALVRFERALRVAWRPDAALLCAPRCVKRSPDKLLGRPARRAGRQNAAVADQERGHARPAALIRPRCASGAPRCRTKRKRRKRSRLRVALAPA
jgi:hypothetical protein